MHQLDRLYEAQNMDVGDIGSAPTPGSIRSDMDLLKLRAIVDNVRESLPPLLELGTAPEIHAADGGPFSFPYHRPSVLSLATADSAQMPEAIGFVLLQVKGKNRKSCNFVKGA